MSIKPFFRSDAMLRVLITFAFGLAGASLFARIGFPAPLLSGSMLGVVLALILGLKPGMPDLLRDIAMFISGCVYGSAITREMLASLAHYPLSLVMLALAVFLIIYISRLWLTLIAKWDATTATFASIPGALSAVLAVAAESNANLARVVVVQSFRSLVIVVLLPSFVTAIGAAHPRLATASAKPWDILIILAISLIGALVFRHLKIVAPFIFGAMLSSAALHIAGVVEGSLPPFLSDLGFVLLGGFFGTRFSGTTLAILKDSLWHAIASLGITMGLAWVFALIVIRFSDIGQGNISMGDVLVAFAPGGLEAMMAVAGSLGLNPLYVGAHHFSRLIGLTILTPIIGAWLARKKG